MPLSSDGDRAGEQPCAVAGPAFLIVDELEHGALPIEKIGTLKSLPDVIGVEFSAEFVRHMLNVAGEIRLELLRQLQALALLEHPGKAALAGLRIDADHRLVAAAEVCGVDRDRKSTR